MDIKIFKDENEWVAASLVRVLHACEVPQADHARIAVSGGKTPVPLYRVLATQADFLKIVEVYQVDERCVPRDDPRSNQKLIQDTLNPPRFITFDTTLAPDKAACNYEKNLLALAPHPFDIVLLGVGDDGHLASLFPHSPALRETVRLTAHTTTDSHDIRDRLTLTFPPIMASKALLVLLSGASKRTALERLMAGTDDPDEFPAVRLAEHPNVTVYFKES